MTDYVFLALTAHFALLTTRIFGLHLVLVVQPLPPPSLLSALKALLALSTLPSYPLTSLLSAASPHPCRNRSRDSPLSYTSPVRHIPRYPPSCKAWRLMLAYMELGETTTPGARDATLSFLLRLGSLAIGCDCSVETLTPLQKQAPPHPKVVVYLSTLRELPPTGRCCPTCCSLE